VVTTVQIQILHRLDDCRIGIGELELPGAGLFSDLLPVQQLQEFAWMEVDPCLAPDDLQVRPMFVGG